MNDEPTDRNRATEPIDSRRPPPGADRPAGAARPTVVLETGAGRRERRSGPRCKQIASRRSRERLPLRPRAARGASDAGRQAAQRTRPGRATCICCCNAPTSRRLTCWLGTRFGGLLVRLFAHRHREQVAGLVLVDAMHEDQFDVFGSTISAAARRRGRRACAERRASSGHAAGATGVRRREGLDLVASCAQARAIDSLGDLPMHVLSAGTLSEPAARAPRPCVRGCRACGTSCSSASRRAVRRTRHALAGRRRAGTSCSARRRSRWPRPIASDGAARAVAA